MERPYIQRLRAGIKPLDKETIRDMLQNRLYTGRVRYTDTVYKGTLGERRTSKRNRSEWFEGRHAAIIDDALFEACQEARKGLLKAVILRQPSAHTFCMTGFIARSVHKTCLLA